MLCPPAASATAPPGPAARTATDAAERLEVRTELVAGVARPELLLRAGRLWLVRRAERQSRAVSGPLERWRVHAAEGPAAPVVVLDLERQPDGSWLLAGERG